jgi:flagellin
MMRVASGNRINSAADDAAGLAIVEGMTAQIRGLDQGTRNTQDMQALIHTADGGLDGISDNLQRIRELSVQAANGTNTPANRELIQAEISQLVTEIESSVSRVEFNSIRVLEGVDGAHTASGADGQGATVNISDMRDLATAIANYNVTGSFDMQEIDDLISDVNMERANLGAMHNRFDHTVSANTLSSLNLADSRSRIRDADMAREMAAVHQERILNDLQIMMQQQQQEREEEQSRIIPPVAGV